MYQQIALILVVLVGVSHATYLAAPVAVAAPALVAPAQLTTSAHVANVVSGVSRSLSSIPHTRFTRTDWNQPGSLITSPIHAPIVQPVFQNVAVAGPTHYSQHLVPNPPLIVNDRHFVHGVAHVPAAVPLPLPVAAAPLAAVPLAAPVAVKGY